MAISKRRPRFKVGDWVTFQYGTSKVLAKIIEYMGPIGVKGRNLYRVLLKMEWTEPDSFDMPEDELEAAQMPEQAETDP